MGSTGITQRKAQFVVLASRYLDRRDVTSLRYDGAVGKARDRLAWHSLAVRTVT